MQLGKTTTSITRDQAKDTGMAMVLICLLGLHFAEIQAFFGAAIVILLINMVWPDLFRLPARFWFGLANLLSTVMSKVVLTAVFFTVIMPIGLLRRLFGADPMLLRQWKASGDSVFHGRDHTYRAKDLERPY